MATTYNVGQYNHIKDATGDDWIFMTDITEGTSSCIVQTGFDLEVSSSESSSSSSFTFQDSGLKYSNGFQAGQTYYFRCDIKRNISPQDFSIKLIKYSSETNTVLLEQFIKKISVKPNHTDWVTAEFIFSPIVSDFDIILFQLNRNMKNIDKVPVIAYAQLSLVKNAIPNMVGSDKKLKKIGVQSHPGLLLCLNGEEIRLSRTGVFEVRNGIVSVDSFSVACAAIDDTTEIRTWEDGIDSGIKAILNDKSYEDEDTREEAIKDYENSITGNNFIALSKTISIDSFALDYMY